MKWTTMKLSLLFIIVLSQLIVLVGYLSYKNINLVLGSWNNSTSLNVYLTADASEQDKSTIQNELKKSASVSQVDFIARDLAATNFQKSMSGYAGGVLSTDEIIDLIPESFIVSLKNDLSLNEKINIFDDIKKTLSSFAGVEDISFGAEWLKKFSNLNQALQSIGLFIFVVILLSVSFLTALMIRVLIDDSKHEIDVYRLLGATRWFVYRLFLKEIIYFGILSLVLAFSATFGVFVYFEKVYLTVNLRQMFSDRIAFLSASELAIFSALVILFILMSSVLTIKTTLKKLNQFSYE